MSTDATTPMGATEFADFEKLLRTENFNGRKGFRLTALQHRWRDLHREFRGNSNKCRDLSAMAMYPAAGCQWPRRREGLLYVPLDAVRVVLLSCVQVGNFMELHVVDHPLWVDLRHGEVNAAEVDGQPSIARQLLLPPRQPQLLMEPVRVLPGTELVAGQAGRVYYEQGPEYLEIRIDSTVLARLPVGAGSTRLQAEGDRVECSAPVVRIDAETCCVIPVLDDNGETSFAQLPASTYCTSEESSLRAALAAWKSLCRSAAKDRVQLPDGWAPLPVLSCTWQHVVQGLLQFSPTVALKHALLQGLSPGGNVRATLPLSVVSRLDEIQSTPEALVLRFNTGLVQLPASAALLESVQPGTWFHPGTPLADFLPRNRVYFRESDLDALSPGQLDEAYLALFRSRIDASNAVTMPLAWLEAFPAEFATSADGWIRISLAMDSQYVSADAVYPTVLSGPAWPRHDQPFAINGIMYDASLSELTGTT